MATDTPTVMENDSQPAGFKRGFNFWMVYASNLVVDMLSALDLTAIAIALPTIVGELHGTDFVWAGSAYAIASTAPSSATSRPRSGESLSSLAGRNLPEPHAEQPVLHTAPAPERKNPEYGVHLPHVVQFQDDRVPALAVGRIMYRIAPKWMRQIPRRMRAAPAHDGCGT
uniref:HC-toxin efflux carrier TOXA n=1 Tax=Ganoderma boninense TaxID=34458 RepID=A0A5K1JY70_9APHY|nr:Putative HC-toxin efflux carrier TOXA [Ganoderma boninense]